MALADLLGQLMNAGNNPYPHADRDFDQVAEQAPPELLGSGVAEAFRSNQTPPFPDMVGQLFGQSDPTQRAGLLNQILAAAGPAILAGGAGGVLGRVLGGGMGGGLGGMGGGLGGLGGAMGGLGGAMGGNPMSQGGLGGILGGILGGAMGGAPMGGAMGNTPMGGAMGGNPFPQVMPEQAQQITPEQMREIAAQAEREQPGIVDQLGDFAARNPQLVKMLGGAAMAIIASKMAQGLRR